MALPKEKAQEERRRLKEKEIDMAHLNLEDPELDNAFQIAFISEPRISEATPDLNDNFIKAFSRNHTLTRVVDSAPIKASFQVETNKSEKPVIYKIHFSTTLTNINNNELAIVEKAKQLNNVLKVKPIVKLERLLEVVQLSTIQLKAKKKI